MTTSDVQDFFNGYARALLDRDERAVAARYAVPGLILFPSSSIVVTDTEQTARFFASSWEQYAGVTDAVADVRMLAETAHSAWADVTWSYDGEPRERFVYQLVRGEHGWQIAVLTPFA